MMSLLVEEGPSKTGVRSSIKYKRTTIVLYILLIYELLKKLCVVS